MNNLDLYVGESYYDDSSTHSRDASLFTSTAVIGEKSKLMEIGFVIVPFDVDVDEVFFLGPGFVFNPLPSEPPVTRTLEIDTLPDPRFSLIRPISIFVSEERGEIKAEIPEVELYTFASNEDEAIHELTQDLLDLYEDLLDISDGKLGKYPRMWKNYLKSIINVK